MNKMQQLENKILALFQEKNEKANDIIEPYMSPTTSPKNRAIIRNILARLEVDNNGNYFIKEEQEINSN